MPAQSVWDMAYYLRATSKFKYIKDIEQEMFIELYSEIWVQLWDLYTSYTMTPVQGLPGSQCSS